MEQQPQHRIPRKPVPLSPISLPPPYTASPTTLSAATTYSSYDDSIFDDYAVAESSTRQRLQYLTVDDRPPSTSPTPTPPLRSTQSSPNLQPQPIGTPLPPPGPTAAQKAGNAAVTAYQEARHFAGGLVSHPFESTKHYSILRHSHGLVFYSGSYTNIAITVFADRPLPPDRTFWLQRRGWSGKTGLRAGVLFGTHGAWINVTPEAIVGAEQVKPTDERAWQRDIAKFLRKAPRKLAEHVPRETAVLRVPCEAEDGYLRIVMCSGENGKKHLCPSPIFRLASTSLESSSLRGASLKTLPLEAAVKVGTAVGTKFVQTAAAPYVASAKAFAVTQATSVFQPSAVQVAAAQHAYDSSGAAERLVKMEEAWETQQINATGGPHQSVSSMEPLTRVVGPEDGPIPPFPVRFTGKAMPSLETQPSSLGFLAATLTNVDSNILLKHSGIFIGYVSVNSPKPYSSRPKLTKTKSAPTPDTEAETLPTSNDTGWLPSLISIIPNPTSRATVVLQKHVSIQLLVPLPNNSTTIPPTAKFTIMLMAFLRPSQTPTTAEQVHQDAQIALQSLARPAWHAEPTLQRVKTAQSQRGITERYVDARRDVQENVLDRVPTHLVGVRMAGKDARRDGFVGRGGFVILR